MNSTTKNSLMKNILPAILLVALGQFANAQVIGGGLSGTGTRILQVNSGGELTPLAPGTSSQILFGNGAWGSLPWSNTGGTLVLAQDLSTPKLVTHRIVAADSNGIHFGDSSIVIPTPSPSALNPVTGTTVQYDQLFSNLGQGRLAIGHARALGNPSLAFGTNSSNPTKAIGNNCIAIGMAGTEADATGSIAMGYNVKTGAAAQFAITLGRGIGTTSSGAMLNNIPNSLAVGFNSDVPTLFVEGGNGTSGSIGKVGVGNNTPQKTLDVTGTFGLSGDATISGNLMLGQLTGSGNRLAVINSSGVISAGSVIGSGNYWDRAGNSGTDEGLTNFIGTTDNKDLIFKTNNTERMRITSHSGNNHEEGRVYIGGGDLVTVNNDLPGNWDDRLVVKDAIRIVDDNISPSKCALIGNDGANTFIESFNINPPDQPGSNWYDSPDGILMGWYSGADVHIGYHTTGQGGNLSVQNQVVIGDKLGIGGLPTARMSIFSSATGDVFNIVGSNTLFSVKNNGNIGIGTSSPTARFTLNNASNYSNGVEVKNGDVSMLLYEINDINGTPAGSNSGAIQVKKGGGPTSIGSGSSNNYNLMLQPEGGNLIIGTTGNSCDATINGVLHIGSKNPLIGSVHDDALLSVYGKMVSTSMYVTVNNWFDNVFEKSYPLLPLQNLEAYVEANKHLPDMPSEKAVLQDGANLGEMVGLLLKKIEENTLYIINQQKEIENLKAELKKLDKK